MLHMSSNIPSTFFNGSISSELLRIARYTLRINDFILRASDLLSRMMAQGGNRLTLPEILKTTFHCYQKFTKFHEEINISIMKNR